MSGGDGISSARETADNTEDSRQEEKGMQWRKRRTSGGKMMVRLILWFSDSHHQVMHSAVAADVRLVIHTDSTHTAVSRNDLTSSRRGMRAFFSPALLVSHLRLWLQVTS